MHGIRERNRLCRRVLPVAYRDAARANRAGGAVHDDATTKGATMTKRALGTVTCGVALLWATQAAATNAEKCNAALVKAAGKYQKCIQSWLSNYYRIGLHDLDKLSKCREKYVATWAKLQGLSNSVCAGARWVDNGSTVTDHLTGLTWEKKTDDGTVHDVDNQYAYGDNGDSVYTDQDGTAFTVFLSDLNAGGGFDGANGWRLPTYAELLTVLMAPCPGPQCLEPIFGGVVSIWRYISVTAYPETALTWHVDLTSSTGFPDVIGTDVLTSVIAVRGGFL